MSINNNTMFFSFSEPLAREHFQAAATKYHQMMDQRVSGPSRQMRTQLLTVERAVNSRFPADVKAEKVLSAVSGHNVIKVSEEGVSFTPKGLLALASLKKRNGRDFDLGKVKHEAVNQGFDAVFQAYQYQKMEKVVIEAEAKRAEELAAEEGSPSSEAVTIDVGTEEADSEMPRTEKETQSEISDQKSAKSKFSWLTSIFSRFVSFLFGWMSSSNKSEQTPVDSEHMQAEERV